MYSKITRFPLLMLYCTFLMKTEYKLSLSEYGEVIVDNHICLALVLLYSKNLFGKIKVICGILCN